MKEVSTHGKLHIKTSISGVHTKNERGKEKFRRWLVQ